MGYAAFFGLENHIRGCLQVRKIFPKYLNYLLVCTIMELERQRVHEEGIVAVLFRTADLLLRRGADLNLVSNLQTSSPRYYGISKYH